MKVTDLRSDTVTRPTPGMLEAMKSARVGDDVLGDDPTVDELEERTAALFGMEAGLFCPSGTMSNQIALRILTRPQDEVICDRSAHIYLYEGGGMAYNSMLSPKLVDGDRGRLSADQVRAAINPPEDEHFARTSLVALENTMNKGGGSIYELTAIREIRAVCDAYGLKLHLDGARIFNALAETGESPDAYGTCFHTVSVCFSKGLGAPVGSVLLGTKDLIREAKRVRKALGGAMRQSGYLAAACLYALDHHVKRLKEDHLRARLLEDGLKNSPYVDHVLPVNTNIVIAKLEGITPTEYLEKLAVKGILGVPFGANAIRFVTHLDVSDDDMDQALKAIRLPD